MTDFQLVDDEQPKAAETKPVSAPRTNPVPISAPHSPEAEQHVIAVCLLDDGVTMRRAMNAGVCPEWFYLPNNRTIFEHALRVFGEKQIISTEVLATELIKRKQFESIGGYAYLFQLTEKIPTTAHAGYFIDQLREQFLVRELIRSSQATIENCRNFRGNLDELTANVEHTVQSIIRKAHVSETPVKRITEFKLPPDNDDNILLGGRGRYIERGGSCIIVSTSGMGKSSLSLQMAVLFALGRSAFGIRCDKPRRSLIIQAEDSEGDIAEVWISILHKLNLSAEEIAQVNANVLIVRDKVNAGDDFIYNMQILAEKFSPDFIWLNPLQNYIKGDITDKAVVKEFLLQGLNRANKDDRWAYMIVHHTVKPAKGKDRGKANWNELMYDMAGSSTLIDWARAIMILKATANVGEFNLHLAKRGGRAGVLKKEGLEYKPSTVIHLKHATGELTVSPEFITAATGAKPNQPKKLPIIFWEEREGSEDEPETPEEAEKQEKAKAKAKATHTPSRVVVAYTDGEILSYFPASNKEPWGHNAVAHELKIGAGMGSSTFCKRKPLLKSHLNDQGQPDPLIEEVTLGQWRRTKAGDFLAERYLKTKP